MGEWFLSKIYGSYQNIRSIFMTHGSYEGPIVLRVSAVAYPALATRTAWSVGGSEFGSARPLGFLSFGLLVGFGRMHSSQTSLSASTFVADALELHAFGQIPA